MPQQQYSFISALDYARFDKPLGANWYINDNLRVSNSRSVASRIVTPFLRGKIGDMEADDILNGKPFIFSIAEYPTEDYSPDKQMALLFTHLVHIQLFINLLWLIKDNSVNFQLGFLQYPHGASSQWARVSSNHLSPLFSRADGSRTEETFTVKDLETAISLYKLYEHPADKILEVEPLVPLGHVDRISRTLYSLQSARARWFIPEKVAYYCTCFESLVSTSSTELAHQVAERVAVLIGSDSFEVIEIYANLKRAYDTRSRFIHGDVLSADESRYITDSQNCDAYLRRLLHIILTDTDISRAINQPQDEVNKFFLNKIFRTPVSG